MKKSLKIFVTGLCLQGNKGGPALALSLIQCIGKELSNRNYQVEWTFSVPSISEEWIHELNWATKYSLDVVPSVRLPQFIQAIYDFNQRKIVSSWLKSFLSSSVNLQMSAICYVGPPSGIGTLKTCLTSERFTNFLLCKLFRKKFAPWTQSYGPLSTYATKQVCKLDLSSQPYIFCRGDECAQSIKNLLPAKKVYSFPDVANSLSFDKAKGRKYLLNSVGIPSNFRNISTLSLSSKLYKKSSDLYGNISTKQKYLELIINMLNYYDHCILVPHLPAERWLGFFLRLFIITGNLRPFYCIALNLSSRLLIIDEDLDCQLLKSIISNASLHIGARYHSLIASLSSGVPSIALSWHPKYKDLMDLYGEPSNIIDLFEPQEDASKALIAKIKTSSGLYESSIHAQISKIKKSIDLNSDLWCNLLLTT